MISGIKTELFFHALVKRWKIAEKKEIISKKYKQKRRAV